MKKRSQRSSIRLVRQSSNGIGGKTGLPILASPQKGHSVRQVGLAELRFGMKGQGHLQTCPPAESQLSGPKSYESLTKTGLQA
jgi:hypothetical protein